MGFLDSDDNKSKTPAWQLEVTDTAKSIRPLSDKPIQVWGHTIPGVKTVGPDGKPLTQRRYSFFMCTSTSRTGQGCVGCTMQDPMWDRLDQKSKTNKKGARVDFPKKPVHLLPVLEVATQQVKLLKGGNGVYKEMDAWYGSQADGQKNLGRCEWSIYKTGKELMTQYHVVRQDATPFSPTESMTAEAAEAVRKGMQDMQPPAPERFMQMINGETGQSGSVLPPVSLQPDLSQGSTFAQPGAIVAPKPAPAPVQFVSGTTVVPPPSNVVTTATPPPAPAVTTPPAATVNVAAEFTAWLNNQPEFQSAGIIQNLVPALKANIGGIDYHKCTPDQLEKLKVALEAKLVELRNKRA